MASHISEKNFKIELQNFTFDRGVKLSLQDQKTYFLNNPGKFIKLINEMNALLNQHSDFHLPDTFQNLCKFELAGRCVPSCQYAHNWIVYFVANLQRNPVFKSRNCAKERTAAGCTRGALKCDFRHDGDLSLRQTLVPVLKIERTIGQKELESSAALPNNSQFAVLAEIEEEEDFVEPNAASETASNAEPELEEGPISQPLSRRSSYPGTVVSTPRSEATNSEHAYFLPKSLLNTPASTAQEEPENPPIFDLNDESTAQTGFFDDLKEAELEALEEEPSPTAAQAPATPKQKPRYIPPMLREGASNKAPTHHVRYTLYQLGKLDNQATDSYETQAQTASANLAIFHKRVIFLKNAFESCAEVTHDVAYKTVFCRSVGSGKRCTYAHTCRYAHDLATLYMRNIQLLNGKYKKEACQHEETFGKCEKAMFCTFLHSGEPTPPRLYLE